MPLEKADLTTINKYVRDVVNRIPPRPIKSHTIGTLTSDLVKAGGVVVRGVQQPKTTTQPLADGPPPNPQDGDIWIATGVDANGTRWQFQYNAESSSAYQWEFIGGSDHVIWDPGSYSPPSTGWYQMGTDYSLPREGDWDIFMSAWFNLYSYSGARQLGIMVNGAISVGLGWFGVANNYGTIANRHLLTGLGAGAVVGPGAAMAGTLDSYTNLTSAYRPVRIK